ncbi:MAG TPA: hypothetical protein VNX21_03130 [Candidatus Thermoplasmatota archaeon]|nr:hypothetical protein [Candidatus Thermoplasmatota archaeon]
MKLFGPRGPTERLLTFAAPQAEAEAAPSGGGAAAMLRLAEAARAADAAERDLEAAKAAYGRAPTRARLEALRRVSVRALEAEAAFDRAWQAASAAWFGRAPPGGGP